MARQVHIHVYGKPYRVGDRHPIAIRRTSDANASQALSAAADARESEKTALAQGRKRQAIMYKGAAEQFEEAVKLYKAGNLPEADKAYVAGVRRKNAAMNIHDAKPCTCKGK